MQIRAFLKQTPKILLLAAPLALGLSMQAQAAPITFTFTGVGDLTLAGTAYASTAFTVIFQADTNDLSNGAYFPAVETLDLGPLGSGTFNDSLYVFNDQSNTAAGFGNILAGGDMFGVINSELGSYDMASNFGPVSGAAEFGINWNNIGTSLGATSFSNFTSSTFSAVTSSVVPEPATLALFAIGVAGLSARGGKAEKGVST